MTKTTQVRLFQKDADFIDGQLKGSENRAEAIQRLNKELRKHRRK